METESQPGHAIYPVYILEMAYSKVEAVGSATALIGVLNGPELTITNLGDSGFLVVRFKNGEPYCPYKSKEQQHSFNVPYQLSIWPKQADLEILRKNNKLGINSKSLDLIPQLWNCSNSEGLRRKNKKTNLGNMLFFCKFWDFQVVLKFS